MATKGLKKVLKAIPGKHSIDSLKKMHMLGDIRHNKESSVV
jgi:hypothetical protein